MQNMLSGRHLCAWDGSVCFQLPGVVYRSSLHGGLCISLLQQEEMVVDKWHNSWPQDLVTYLGAFKLQSIKYPLCLLVELLVDSRLFSWQTF